MPRATAVAAVLLCLSAGPALLIAQERDSMSVQHVPLGHGIHLFTASSALDYWTSSNTVVIIGDDGVVVFDNSARPSTSRQVIAAIRRLTNQPVRTLINSHWHMDHWFGNEEYAKAFPGLQIIATAETRGYMSRLPLSYFVTGLGLARFQARLDTAVRLGRLPDGRALTPALRAEAEADVRRAQAVTTEIAATRQVLPTLTFSDSLTLWAGSRELRLVSLTGDASGSAVLYLPAERLLVTGDVLVRTEDGVGVQPWTTNSYRIRPWLASLKALDALDVATIVPGQGAPLHDKTYLRNTIDLYDSLIRQVHAALERGAVRFDEVESQVKLDDIRVRFTRDDPAQNSRFNRVVASLMRKTIQEARDGIAAP